jgi:hypothetical protein
MSRAGGWPILSRRWERVGSLVLASQPFELTFECGSEIGRGGRDRKSALITTSLVFAMPYRSVPRANWGQTRARMFGWGSRLDQIKAWFRLTDGASSSRARGLSPLNHCWKTFRRRLIWKVSTGSLQAANLALDPSRSGLSPEEVVRGRRETGPEAIGMPPRDASGQSLASDR